MSAVLYFIHNIYTVDTNTHRLDADKILARGTVKITESGCH